MLEYTRFQFCPRCGQQRLYPNDAKSFICQSCGLIYYHSSAAVAAAIIEYQDKIILTRRAFEPHKGALALPGGFVDYGEGLEEALIRELQEELNISVASPNYLCSEGERYESRGIIYFCSTAFFIVKIDDISTLSARDDVSDYLLIKASEIDLEKLAFETDRVAIEKYRKLIASYRS